MFKTEPEGRIGVTDEAARKILSAYASSLLSNRFIFRLLEENPS